MKTAAAKTVATQTSRGSAGLSMRILAQTNYVPEPFATAFISSAAFRK
jgi:hypothetical protein